MRQSLVPHPLSYPSSCAVGMFTSQGPHLHSKFPNFQGSGTRWGKTSSLWSSRKPQGWVMPTSMRPIGWTCRISRPDYWEFWGSSQVLVASLQLQGWIKLVCEPLIHGQLSAIPRLSWLLFIFVGLILIILIIVGRSPMFYGGIREGQGVS